MSKPRHPYPSHVFWSDEDGGYIATAPDLPGSSAFGATEAEALVQLKDAIAAWISAATEAGNPIPAPSRPRPATQASGRILLRLPKELHASLLREASTQETSLNQWVLYLLTAASVRESIAATASRQLLDFAIGGAATGTPGKLTTWEPRSVSRASTGKSDVPFKPFAPWSH